MPKKVKIELDFDVEDAVYLKTDTEQHLRMVTGITLRPGGVAYYLVRYADEEETEHFACELSDTKDLTEK